MVTPITVSVGLVSSENVPAPVGFAGLTFPFLREATCNPLHDCLPLFPRHITQAPTSIITTSLFLGLPASLTGTLVIIVGSPISSTQDSLVWRSLPHKVSWLSVVAYIYNCSIREAKVGEL